MPFNIVKADITKMSVEAVVNAANRELRAGSGVCGAIFAASGYAELTEACENVAPVKTGCATITPAFNLSAKYIIHAVGPVYDDYPPEESQRLLYSAYKESLKLAKENGIRSIAFPLISSGIYGYPKEEALQVASEAIKDFLASAEMDVYLAVLDKSSFVVNEKLLGRVDAYIDSAYNRDSVQVLFSRRMPIRRDAIEHASNFKTNESKETPQEPEDVNSDATFNEICCLSDIDPFIEKLDEPFDRTLLRLIRAKRMSEVEVYKKANIDRKLFSKIRTGRGYMPSKRTVVALAIALELSLDETKDLLERAGFALSHSQVFDVIIEYFIVNKNYDIYEINEVLFKYDQPLLGA